MPQISIIVPVYNTEKYLHRCIDSILSQTFRDFELLLINDGSTDSSAIVCDEYLSLDSRIKVFHKENGGVSSARNFGLDRAMGEWITFIDSDDWVSEKYLENLYPVNTAEVDFVISYAKCFGKNGEIPQRKYEDRHVNPQEIETLFLKNDFSWQTSPWAKLYKKELCNDIRFVEGMHIGEDLMFLYTYIMRCARIYVSGSEYYNYDMSRDNTLTKSVGMVEAEVYVYTKICQMLEEFIEYYGIRNESVLEQIDWIKSYYIGRVLNAVYHTPNMKRKDRLICLSSVKMNIYLKYYKRVTLKEKMLYFLLKNDCLCLYDFFRILASKIR